MIGDLPHTQLLYAALDDAALSGQEVATALHRHGNRLPEAVVRRLHASTTAARRASSKAAHAPCLAFRRGAHAS